MESQNLRTNFLKEKINKIYEKLKDISAFFKTKKPIRLLIVFIVFISFIWSLINVYQNKTFTFQADEIKKTKELITEKLKQADDVSELNLARSIALLGDAKKDLTLLKNQLKGKNQNEIKSLEEIINKFETKIIKSEEKKYEEFYDLFLENKKSKGTRISLFKDNAIILDNNNGYIYTLSLTKKSINKRKSSIISNAKLIAAYEDNIYFYTKEIIYNIDANNKTKKIIKKDSEWKNIIELVAYAGNLYVLDEKSSKIYKYSPTDQGFSDKKNYFAPGLNINLNDATSFAIDSSVYIGFPKTIVKYTSGLRDGFTTSYPEDEVNISKIYTDQESNNVYALSKSNGILYVLSKNGSYEKQIRSSILTKITDFIVYKNMVFATYGSKIFSIEIE